MNRGRGRQTIFHSSIYFHAFLTTLQEAHQRFGARIHAYCLMGNHYHLVLETPYGDLSRIMRHINGMYTQRYNRLKNTDGPLFRGRYKAILVDKDSYLLPLSRYIHRNPIETKNPNVKQLAAYRWSSYPAYINKCTAPSWLQRDLVYAILGKRNCFSVYKSYVAQGIDEEIQTFYNKLNLRTILGNDHFAEKAFALNGKPLKPRQIIHAQERPGIEAIIDEVSRYFKVTRAQISTRKQGQQQRNMARKIAMYLCQQCGAHTLSEIANAFGVSHEGSVSNAISEIRQLMQQDKTVAVKVNKLLKMIQRA